MLVADVGRQASVHCRGLTQLFRPGILHLRVQKLLHTVEHFDWNVFRTDGARGTHSFFVGVQKGNAIGAAV